MTSHFDPDNQELAFVGVARSGNHAIIHWALAHLKLGADIAFLNNIGVAGDALQCASGFGVIPHHASPLEAKGMAYSFEDETYKTCLENIQHFRPNTTIVLILRDPFNLFASKIMHSKGANDATPFNHSVARVWSDHADAFIATSKDRCGNTVVPISYNAWYRWRWYRDWKGAQLGFVNEDLGIDLVPPHGTGSSFDGLELDGRARSMDVLGRWRSFAGDQEWRELLTPDVIAKAKQIFGRSFVDPILTDLAQSPVFNMNLDLLKVDHHRALREAAVRDMQSYPHDRFQGRGIVICGGGRKYFPNVWVLVNELRRLGCVLPIQIWYLGSREWSEEMKGLICPLDVEFCDAFEMRKLYPMRILNGYEVKSYALVHSSFREILLLDADNVPVVNPEYLFDTDEFRRDGAVFWPDFGRLGIDRTIWKILDLEYRDEPEVESGQLLVDKERCWRPLLLALHLNEHSDFYYRHIHGDKETFHLAWRLLNIPYSMPDWGIHHLGGCTMCQHDFEGKRIFQHRNMAKWNIDTNRRVADFWNEDICLAYLAKLRESWSGWTFAPEMPATDQDRTLVEEINDHGEFCIFEPRHVSRITLTKDWLVKVVGGDVVAKWCVADGMLVFGYPEGDRCLYEKREIEGSGWEWVCRDTNGNDHRKLLPTLKNDCKLSSEVVDVGIFIYKRHGLDEREVKLLWDGTISVGAAKCERSWAICRGELWLSGDDGVIASLRRREDLSWSGRWLKHERCEVSMSPLEHKRRVLVVGLQRTGTNLVTRFCKRALRSPTNEWAGKGFWKHGLLPSDELMRGCLLIICVRHPLDWLVAQYRYFVREHGRDMTVDPGFAPDVEFAEFVRRPHYEWETPMHRWNVMNQYWLGSLCERPVESVLVRLEDLQSPALQTSEFGRIGGAYNPGGVLHLEDALCSIRVNNVGLLTGIPSNRVHFQDHHYLHNYSRELKEFVLSALDKQVAARFGYSLDV